MVEHVTNTAASRVHNLMVPNPVYESGHAHVYDSIQPKFETLVADVTQHTTVASQPESSPARLHVYGNI